MSNIFSAVCTLTRDAEKRFTPSGAAILNVNVANNQGFGDKQKAMFIRIALFGKRAEGNLIDYLKKGTQVFVSGELSVNEYQAQDGTTKQSLELNANVLDLVGGRREAGNSNTQQNTQRTAQPARQNNQPDEQFSDDIPF